MIEAKKYNLPDTEILYNDDTKYYHIWHPEQKYLVIGQGNKVDTSLYTEKVAADNIQVYKRPSGGETVILTPKTLVISAITIDEKFKNPSIYFKHYNTILMEAFREMGIQEIGQKGISDICIGNKKIVGSSIYRRKNKVFYHAVINVKESINEIAKYIKHPSKEPDYREGRNHTEFVTSIFEQGYSFTIGDISNKLREKFDQSL